MADEIENAAERASAEARAQVANIKAEFKQASLEDYLSFRAMITPILIQVIFWLGVVAIVLTAIVAMGETGFLSGLLILLLGPLFWRIYCEIFMVIFKINDGVQALNRKADM